MTAPWPRSWRSTRFLFGFHDPAANAMLGMLLYLMHPVIFFGLAWVVLPRLGAGAPASWSLAAQAVFTLAVLLAAFTLALLSERYFEHPLRERSKKRMA